MTTCKYTNAPLILLIVNMFISQLGVGLIIPVLPAYLQLFDASGAVLGYLVSAMGVTLFFLAPIAGALSDRYGRKRIIVFGLSMFCLSQFLFAWGTELWLLYLSRLIGGVGIAFTSPAITAYVADTTTESDRGKGMSWISAAMTSGIVIGPGIGGLLAGYGLHIPFYFAAAASALAMLASILILPETRSPEAMAAARADKKAKTLNVFRQFVLSLHLPYRSLLLLFFILTFILTSVEVIYGLYLDAKYGYTPQDIAILFTVGSLAGVIVQTLFAAKLLQRFGEKAIIRFTLVCSVLSLLLLLLPGTFYFVLAVTIFFFSVAAILRPALSTLLSKMAGSEQGFAAGISNAYASLAIIAGPAMVGNLFDIHIKLPYIFGAILIMASLIIPFREKPCKASVISQSETT